jgi:hypothetical protein
VGTYRVSLSISFSPALTIARQQQVMEALEALHPESLDFTDAGLAVELLAQGADSEAAHNDAEFSVARVLSAAGHTMSTAPIRTRRVTEVG